jgi:hypothetical protein
MEIYTAEPLIPEPSPFGVEIGIAKFKGINLQETIKFREN